MASTAFRIHGVGECSGTLAAASQLLKPAKIPVTLYGLSGDDSEASELRFAFAQTPLDFTCFRQRPGSTAEISRKVDSETLGESFSQATLNLFSDVETFPQLSLEFSQLLAKARHRGALSIVASTESLSQFNHNVDLLVTSLIAVEKAFPNLPFHEAIARLFSEGLSSLVVLKSPTEIFYKSIGGVFGQASGEINASDFFKVFSSINPLLLDWTNAQDNSPGTLCSQLFLSGIISDLILQIYSDDFYPKGEVHVERELLYICPLRLHHAIIFALATSLHYFSLIPCDRTTPLDSKIPLGSNAILSWKENLKGQRMAAVQKLNDAVSPAGQPW